MISKADQQAIHKLVRVVSIVEGTYVTGPIRPLLMFAGALGAGNRAAEISMVTTVRSSSQKIPSNTLLEAVGEAGIHMDVVRESGRFDFRVVPQLVRILRWRSPTIVETHDTKCHFLLLMALKFGGLQRNFKWIAYHHGYTRTSWLVRLYRHLDRLSLRAADRVVTVCEPFKDELQSMGVPASRVTLISNPAPRLGRVPDMVIRSLRHTLGIGEGQRVLVTVGRLSTEKGHADLVRALPRISRQLDQPIVLVCVGDGPERQSLEADALRLQSQVVFAGQQPNVVPYLQMADIFVMPSHSEGSPLALLEAMAMGCPLVVSRVGGIPEMIVDNVNGLLVPARNEVEMTAAIVRLLMDSANAKLMGNAAAVEASRRSVEHYLELVLDIYARVLQVPR